MKLFLSSTFADLVEERDAVLKSLAARQQATLAMEYFPATPHTPLDAALQNLRNSDVVILVIGFKAGSILPLNPGTTYTRAEYEEALKLDIPILVFVRVGKKWPWSSRAEWLNKEHAPIKRHALSQFRAAVGSTHTWSTFSTPDGLALAVIQSLDKWESQGRPGARKTFATAAEYFASKPPQKSTPILDFGTTLFGRDAEVKNLNSFLLHNSQKICILKGRGGIGKTKLIHDWCKQLNHIPVIFLKDQPLWHEASEKEIPTGPVVLIVDDAHRSNDLPRITQILNESRWRHKMKLVLSTRPGSSVMLRHAVSRGLDPSEIIEQAELNELHRDQARELAREVLGKDFAIYAEALADIAGCTPLVIVAGGRLIASHRVRPMDLTNEQEFRKTIFDRFLDELRLDGPDFQISPTRPLLDLIAALGPVDADSQPFLSTAEKFLNRRADEILSTIDALAKTGILSARGNQTRVLPDVLSDFILEDRCVGASRRTTRYADQVFENFGAEFFRNLMRNLSELDWRLGRVGEEPDLLLGIWQKIEKDFLNSDEYNRHTTFNELFPAAVYQPDKVLHLIGLALKHPIADVAGQGARYRAGQAYVLEAIPSLLVGTAQHPTHIERSIDLLWELSKSDRTSDSSSRGASGALKQLAAYHFNGWVGFNFAMLLQAIRLSRRPDAFDRGFTPFDMIDELLQREGEFNEFEGNVMTFGGFGLNIAVVGPLRQNVLEFLDFSLKSDNYLAAARAAQSLGSTLPSYLNRVGRASSDDEIEWQNSERMQVLEILSRRYEAPLILLCAGGFTMQSDLQPESIALTEYAPPPTNCCHC